MTIDKSFEQGIYVLCILALQSAHTPVKSETLSRLLGVSDSYLKKLLAKMTKAHLIESQTGRSGGYQLARPVTQITLSDVFSGLHLDQDIFEMQHLADRIFADSDHAGQSENCVLNTVHAGFRLFCDHLRSVKISDLLRSEYLNSGYCDWNQQ